MVQKKDTIELKSMLKVAERPKVIGLPVGGVDWSKPKSDWRGVNH